jgi:hypothetical protein
LSSARQRFLARRGERRAGSGTAAMPRPCLLVCSFVGAAFVLGGCGAADLGAEGEGCVATSACAEGLTCDFRAEPPVCRREQTPLPPDAAADPVDAAPVDGALPIDAAPPPIDAAPPPVDAAPPPVDAAPSTDGGA